MAPRHCLIWLRGFKRSDCACPIGPYERIELVCQVRLTETLHFLVAPHPFRKGYNVELMPFDQPAS